MLSVVLVRKSDEGIRVLGETHDDIVVSAARAAILMAHEASLHDALVPERDPAAPLRLIRPPAEGSKSDPGGTVGSP